MPAKVISSLAGEPPLERAGGRGALRDRLAAGSKDNRCAGCAGRTQDYDPSTDRVSAPSIAMPVCLACAREARERRVPGHHPRLVFTIESGRTVLITRNETLADLTLALNPGARRLSDARAAKGGATSSQEGDKDDQAKRIATGTVSPVLVEGLLAEVEATLGRRDLRSRYRALRDQQQETMQSSSVPPPSKHSS